MTRPRTAEQHDRRPGKTTKSGRALQDSRYRHPDFTKYFPATSRDEDDEEERDDECERD